MPSFNKSDYINSIEMVLLDEKGTKIQASIKRSLFTKFQTSVKEQKVFIITNFVVSQNCGSFKATQHSYKINLLYSTSLRELDDAPIHTYGFQFTPYDQILSSSVDDSYLVDVIGQVTATGSVEISTNNGKQCKRVNVELTDKSHNVLSCTLWDDFANQICSFVETENQTNIIIVLQFAKIKIWKGTPALSNSMFGSRLLINADIPEVVSFKNSICDANSGKSTISHLSSHSALSITDEFLQICDRKTLEDIRDATEESSCVVLATILCIETEYNWFYNSCKKCRKKVKPDSGKYWCDKCFDHVNSVTPRFKVQVKVMDDTSSASFVLFDREAQQVIGKSAYELREQLIKDGDSDCFPDALNILLQKRFLFKIQISSYNLKANYATYTVARMTNDEKIIESYTSICDEPQSIQGESMIDVVNCVTPISKRPIHSISDDDVQESQGLVSNNMKLGTCNTNGSSKGGTMIQA